MALIKKAREITTGDWVGSIFKATWKPFVLTLAVSCAAALALHVYFPNALRLIDVLR